MLDDVKRFDMSIPPKRQIATPLIQGYCLLDLWLGGQHLTKVNMGGIKPPYLMLCNHNAFKDFKVAMKATFPHKSNFVVAIDGYVGREWLLRQVGGICKRKYTSDITLVKHLKRATDKGRIVFLYPEARYSGDGTTTIMPNSLGKLAKLLKVPVVTLITHGHHINKPFWSDKCRFVRGTTATMTCVATAEDVKKLSTEELDKIITDAFKYDDYSWQKENNIVVNKKWRAEGLHRLLYKCPHCSKEYQTTTQNSTLTCNACGKSWELTPLGELKATSGKTEFARIPDWYAWERDMVRKELLDKSYSLDVPARIEALPNAKRFINLGTGRLQHGLDGFNIAYTYNGKEYTFKQAPNETYTISIEYNYWHKGACITLNTNKDTLFIYPESVECNITKILLATEELYKLVMSNERNNQ